MALSSGISTTHGAGVLSSLTLNLDLGFDFVGNWRITVDGPLPSEDQSFGLSESVDLVLFLSLFFPLVQAKSLIGLVHAPRRPVQWSFMAL